jgi:hypothetical protein
MRSLLFSGAALILASLSLWSATSHAVDQSDTAKANRAACEQIEQACGQAGFVRGLAHESDGKDLDKACVQPILKGQNVAGVVVDADIIKKCQQAKQIKPQSTGRRRH